MIHIVVLILNINTLMALHVNYVTQPANDALLLVQLAVDHV